MLAEVHDVVDHLAKVDFACSEAIVQMLETLPSKGGGAVRQLSVEVFPGRRRAYIVRFTDSLEVHLRRPLLEMMTKFDIVGTTKTILPKLRELGALLGVETRLHEEVVYATSSPKQIDRPNPAVTRALREAKSSTSVRRSLYVPYKKPPGNSEDNSEGLHRAPSRS